MEHEMAEMIRKKIRSEENKAADWNRSEVWDRINNTERSSTPLFRYAAAAAIILGGLLLFYSSHPVAENAVISFSDEKTNVKPAPVDALEFQITVGCIEPEKQMPKEKSFKKILTPEIAIAFIDSTQKENAIENRFTVVADTFSVQERRVVQAILGVIPEENNQTGVVAKTGNIQFEFLILRADNLIPLADREAKTISARIK